jgi:hypothetical protein
MEPSVPGPEYSVFHKRLRVMSKQATWTKAWKSWGFRS